MRVEMKTAFLHTRIHGSIRAVKTEIVHKGPPELEREKKAHREITN